MNKIIPVIAQMFLIKWRKLDLVSLKSSNNIAAIEIRIIVLNLFIFIK
jgi:hypothetical protein